MKIIIISFLTISLLHPAVSQITSGIVSDFIRTNVIGYPVIHDQKAWVFDPDVALKRRQQFVELHGDKGEKLIERLGLGIDGKYKERLEEQKNRDEGHLGGLNAYLP